MAEKIAKSPYQKYKKKPFRYSPQYQAWFSAVQSSGKESVEKASKAHSAMLIRQFGPDFFYVR